MKKFLIFPRSRSEESSLGAGARAVRPKTLGEVLRGVETLAPATNNPEILQIACDSRKVKPGALFFALRGAKENGAAFVQDAIARGAVAIASEERLAMLSTGTNVADVQVRESRKALAISAANFFDHPAKSLKLVAVTGTNGKTTTTSVIDAIVKASRAKTGLFGTIAYETPAGKYAAPNTTPESVDLQGFLAEIRDAGGKYATLEASSHSLTMDRLWGCHFAAAVFTNLTREHLDYHKTFEDYFAAKKTLFSGTGAGVPDTAIINIDDQYGKQLLDLAKKTVTYRSRRFRGHHHQKVSADVSGPDIHRAIAQWKIANHVEPGRADQRVQHFGRHWRGAGAGHFK